MDISVVIPVYNIMPLYLEQCVSSAINQTYKPFEIILVNDGSTREETLDCLKTFKEDDRLLVIDQENKRTCGALNTGIKNMKTDWWAGLSADDRWYSNKLEKQKELYINNQEARVIYADYNMINSQNVILQERYAEPSFNTLIEQQRFVIGSYFGMWTNMLVHKEVFDKVGMFNEEFVACEDYEMLVRISQYYLYYKVPEVLSSYRVHNEQTTNGDYGFQGRIGKEYDAKAHQLAYKLFNNRG